MCFFFSVEAEDNKDIVKQDDKRAHFNQSTDCAESSLRMAHLVIDGIDTVLHQTKYFDKEGGDVKNFVVLNRWQCCHLAKKLSKMKVWLLQEHQNLQTIPGATLALQHLLWVVQRANVLVQKSYRSEFSWLRAAVLQAGNEEAFVGIFQDLKWCTHIINVTLKSGMSTSQEILSVGNRENLDWLQEDHPLGNEADLDKRELLENLTQSKQHNSSFQKHDDAIRQYLLERYSQHVRDWAVEGDLPLLLWDIEGDNALPVMEQFGHGAYGEVHKTSWWELRLCNEDIPSCYRVEYRIQKRDSHLDKPQAPQHYATDLLHRGQESMLRSDGAHVYRPSQIDGQENVRPSQPQGAILHASGSGHHSSDGKGLEVHAWKGSGPSGYKTLQHSCNSCISPRAGRSGLCGCETG